MNIVRFTRLGDVIANDPVSEDNHGVRRVYDRAQFENVWIPTSRSGGITYVVYDNAHPLPANVSRLPRTGDGAQADPHVSSAAVDQVLPNSTSS